MERKILFSCVGEAEYSHPSVSAGHWFQDPKWYQNPRLPKSHKMVHLHITYAHPLLDIKSSMHYLMHHKCYVSRCQCTTNSSFAFWNFLGFFPSNIFNLRLVECGLGNLQSTVECTLFCEGNWLNRVTNLVMLTCGVRIYWNSVFLIKHEKARSMTGINKEQ